MKRLPLVSRGRGVAGGRGLSSVFPVPTASLRRRVLSGRCVGEGGEEAASLCPPPSLQRGRRARAECCVPGPDGKLADRHRWDVGPALQGHTAGGGRDSQQAGSARAGGRKRLQRGAPIARRPACPPAAPRGTLSSAWGHHPSRTDPRGAPPLPLPLPGQQRPALDPGASWSGALDTLGIPGAKPSLRRGGPGSGCFIPN